MCFFLLLFFQSWQGLYVSLLLHEYKEFILYNNGNNDDNNDDGNNASISFDPITTLPTLSGLFYYNMYVKSLTLILLEVLEKNLHTLDFMYSLAHGFLPPSKRAESCRTFSMLHHTDTNSSFLFLMFKALSTLQYI